jgi:hypothetical protein
MVSRQQAIQWAQDKEVDIISMSFAIPEYYNKSDEYARKLTKQVKQADDKKIIQMCSHHDEGWNVDKYWPAQCGQPKIIVACNEYGVFPDREPGEYHYQIHGMDIFTGSVTYLECKDTMSGSSVATAIASGLASLVLSCERLQSPNHQTDIDRRQQLVNDAFEKMSDPRGGPFTSNKRYLQLGKFSNFAGIRFSWFDGLMARKL